MKLPRINDFEDFISKIVIVITLIMLSEFCVFGLLIILRLLGKI